MVTVVNSDCMVSYVTYVQCMFYILLMRLKGKTTLRFILVLYHPLFTSNLTETIFFNTNNV